MTDPLIAELRDDACKPLLERLVKKLKRGESLTGVCQLRKLTEAQRTRIKELTGSKSRGPAISVNLTDFDAIIRNTGRFSSLQALVDATVGPIVNLRAERDSDSAAWKEVWEEANQRVSDDELMIRCFADLRQSGWLRKITKRDPSVATELLQQSFGLITRLPVTSRPLAVFAAEQLGDAHALDTGTILSRLMLRLIAAKQQVDIPRRASGRRRLWESVGIVIDELSVSALAMNLPALGDSLSDQMLQQHQANGMPCRLTFRHLRLHPPSFHTERNTNAEERRVYVCENPSVIAAASDRHGAQCKPMVCVEGNPNLACLNLLSLLKAAGYGLAYHGDFDWGGLRIANRIFKSYGFIPWQFTAAHHRRAVSNTGRHKMRPLRPPESEGLWDDELAPSIKQSNIAIEEEVLIEDLLKDLRADVVQ